MWYLAEISRCDCLTIFLFLPVPGLKALALLGVLPDGDSTSENQALPVTMSMQTSEEQLEKKTVQLAEEPADAGLFVPSSVRSVSLPCGQLVFRDQSYRGTAGKLRTWVMQLKTLVPSFGLYSANK